MKAMKPRRFVAWAWLPIAFVATAAGAASIVDEWSTVKVPPPPALKAVTVDRKTTALLMLDFNKQTCNTERRPRCIASIPKVAKLLASARGASIPIVYSPAVEVRRRTFCPRSRPRRTSRSFLRASTSSSAPTRKYPQAERRQDGHHRRRRSARCRPLHGDRSGDARHSGNRPG
jgi:hypothetical protein